MSLEEFRKYARNTRVLKRHVKLDKKEKDRRKKTILDIISFKPLNTTLIATRANLGYPATRRVLQQLEDLGKIKMYNVTTAKCPQGYKFMWGLSDE